MQIKAIIFDFGGVLIKWDPFNLFYKNFPHVPADEINRFIQDVNFYEWNLLQDKGRSFDDGIAELTVRFPQYTDFIRAYHEHWEDSITGSINGTVDILRRLKKMDYYLCGLTNFSVEKFDITYLKYDFFQLFDRIIVSGKVKMIKPQPEIFRLALSHIGFTAEECLFIDDSINNINAAKELGIYSIQFTSSDELDIKLRELKLF